MKVEIRNLGQADFIVKDGAEEITIGPGSHVILSPIGEVLVSEKLSEQHPVSIPEPVHLSDPPAEVEQTTIDGEYPEVDSHVA